MGYTTVYPAGDAMENTMGNGSFLHTRVMRYGVPRGVFRGVSYAMGRLMGSPWGQQPRRNNPWVESSRVTCHGMHHEL